jgi:hypothetical protein
MLMEGYGYSVWLVPRNHAALRERYGMVHIPHIAVETNLERPPYMVPQRGAHKVRHFSEYTPLPGGMYGVISSGFFCQSRLVHDHRPYMSIRYNEYKDRVEPPWELECDLVAADTRSLDPSAWSIIPAHAQNRGGHDTDPGTLG